MNDVRVVDVWFEGEKFEIPRGLRPGWGLHLFFGVGTDEDLYVLDSSSALKTKVPCDTVKYFVSNWDRFYRIISDKERLMSGPETGPRVFHMKSGENPKDAVYVGRPSDFGNPFRLRDESKRADVVAKYRVWIKTQPALIAKAREKLKGKPLGCWCAPKPCHADVLLEIANSEPGTWEGL